MSKNKKQTAEEPRKFNGKLENFSSVHERNLEKKRLKAYLRGDRIFSYKTDEFKNPIYYNV
jgi:hypothetical protein